MRKQPLRPWRATALLLASLCLPTALCAQGQSSTAASTAPSTPTAPKRTDPGAAPTSVMWVGNSFFYYNNSLHNHFGRLVASAGAGSRVRGISVTVSGSGLDWHDMASLLRPDGLGRYSFVGDN